MPRRQLTGVVVSDRMTKTLVVRVTRLVRHPLYQRVIRHSKKFKVHDPFEQAHGGDEVQIEETRPLSKEKHWRLVRILRKGVPQEDREAQAVAELQAVGAIQKKEGPKKPEGHTEVPIDDPDALHRRDRG